MVVARTEAGSKALRADLSRGLPIVGSRDDDAPGAAKQSSTGHGERRHIRPQMWSVAFGYVGAMRRPDVSS